MQGLWNLIGKGQGPGRDFNYEIGEVMQEYDGKSVWTLHVGKNKVGIHHLCHFEIPGLLCCIAKFLFY